MYRLCQQDLKFYVCIACIEFTYVCMYVCMYIQYVCMLYCYKKNYYNDSYILFCAWPSSYIHTYIHTHSNMALLYSNIHTYIHNTYIHAANLSKYPTLIEPVPYRTSTR